VSLVVALLNRKGGVGKTSACHHLAGALARAGRRVLLVDLDPQASLTQGLLGPAAAAAVPADRSAAAAFGEPGEPAAAAAVRLTFPGGGKAPPVSFDLVPGHPSAADFNTARPDLAGPNQLALRDYLAAARGGYDVVLIDCPPNLQLLSRAAVVAADGVVVPLQPEDYGAQGIAAVAAEVLAVRAGANPGVRLLGYLLTMVQRAAVHQAYAQQLRARHGPAVFAAEVPRAVAFAEAIVARKPIGVYRPRSAAARAVEAVAAELVARAAAGDAGEGRAAA
jgi:chromosome partitioning protein